MTLFFIVIPLKNVFLSIAYSTAFLLIAFADLDAKLLTVRVHRNLSQ
ncbi:Uncharacterised protein [Vibrio cholerae]|nr:Uncharacterised protein [Vibrio cholerae]CRZ99869.1 Uncharacterised protein [Vibrio cholerae]CSI44272.1 Uncharacterised protein [Vibrio cholerae]